MKLNKIVSCLVAGGLMFGGSVAQADNHDLSVVVNLVDAHVKNFNPYNDAVGHFFATDFIYEPLWIPNLANADNPIPVLATSYEISDDLKSVVFNLRQGVKWSDGEDFNADDVVFTMELKKNHPTYNIRGLHWYDAETQKGNVIGVEKLDDYRVKINLQKGNALAYLGLGSVYPLPEHVWKNIDDPVNYRNDTPIATGPFVNIDHFSPNLIRICKNENYWQPNLPQVSCLKFPQYSGNAQAQAAGAVGDIDWMGVGILNTKAYTSKSEDAKFWYSSAGTINLQLNTTKAPFNNLEFRKAMSVAINRQDLRDFATQGAAAEVFYPIGSSELYKSWYDSANLEKYKYLMGHNPELAKKILDKAGIIDQDNDGWRDMPNGEPIKFKISVPSGWTDWVNGAMQISENMKDIGINAMPHTPDANAWFETVPRGDMDVYFAWNHVNAVPWGTYNDYFNPSDMKKDGITLQALHRLQLPEVKERLEKFTQTSDQAMQKKHLSRVHELVAENLPIITLYAAPGWYQYNTARFEGWVTPENPTLRPMVHGGYPERWAHVLSLKPKKQ